MIHRRQPKTNIIIKNKKTDKMGKNIVCRFGVKTPTATASGRAAPADSKKESKAVAHRPSPPTPLLQFYFTSWPRPPRPLVSYSPLHSSLGLESSPRLRLPPDKPRAAAAVRALGFSSTSTAGSGSRVAPQCSTSAADPVAASFLSSSCGPAPPLLQRAAAMARRHGWQLPAHTLQVRLRFSMFRTMSCPPLCMC